ncbi:MAG: mandelate racemase/muconate lactonizing enzyme family protein [candidate division Zixibacteria bacterium]|nr:mandelate racemase/muconate lactonizing enzyme family protein [candidate division Zixibacteria bacterium]
MKIASIRTFPVWVGHRNQLIVKIESDDGCYGWGESGISGRELAVEGAIRHYREFLIGKDPRRIGALWQEMYRSQYFEGGRILTGAISAIDIALHDLVARSLGIPVYRLLGGAHRDIVPGFVTSIGLDGPAVVEHAQKMVADGWQSIRFVPGHPDTGGDPNLFEPRESIGLTAEWLNRVREAVGPGPVLGIDYHHRLSVAEAASFCQRLLPGALDFLEEPIRDECPDAYASLRTMTPVPFAIGEEFSSKWQFLPYIERGLTQFARIDICNVGGFTEAIKVAGWCEAHYIDMMPHNPLGPISTAAHVHFSAAVPNFAWLESREREFSFGDDLFPKQIKLAGCGYPLPEEPGLGVEFDETLAQEAFRFWEAPHLHRRDGSYTNW